MAWAGDGGKVDLVGMESILPCLPCVLLPKFVKNTGKKSPPLINVTFHIFAVDVDADVE